MIDFQNEPLGDMVAVGAVLPRTVRLWMRSDRPGRMIVHYWPAGAAENRGEAGITIPEENDRDNTTSILLPRGDGLPLRPLTRYRYRVFRQSDGHVLGEGGFETAPATPEKTPSPFSIALMSCHQPFKENGSLSKQSHQMLRAVRQCLVAHNTKCVFMVGDQMYSDLPGPLSLLNPAYFPNVAPPGRRRLRDCSTAEVRRLYHRRYRHFWNLPEWKKIQSEFPCYPILDDHDIIDNWGSDPAHKTEEWQSLGEGAMAAYFDYQGSRLLPGDGNRPDDFSYGFTYGNTATFVLDIRSHRTAGPDGQLYSDAQEQRLRNFLYLHQYRKILFIVLSVPIIHLPRFLARIAARVTHAGEDFSDRWSSGAHLRDRDRFLKILHDHQVRHPWQQTILLSGDIHIGCIHQILWGGNWPVLYQMVSSGITHYPGFLIQLGSKILIRMNQRFATADRSISGKVALLKGNGRRSRNPYGGMNLGIIEVETPAPNANPGIRFFLYGHKHGEPYQAFSSSLLSNTYPTPR